MRVVNNPVMTPAVMTTMPSSVPSNTLQGQQAGSVGGNVLQNSMGNHVSQLQVQQHQSVSHQMRPPPGLQAVTVQPNDPVQVQLSPSQR